MAETDKLGNGTVGRGGVPRDVVSLDDDAPSPIPNGESGAAAAQDSVLNVAHVFEEQLEQMTAWKHQLAQQMELLRRDGVKLLERQKNLALEKKRLAEERESITADRVYVQKLHGEMEEENKRLAAKGVEIARGLAELERLAEDKRNGEKELQAARAGAVKAKEEAEKMRGEVAAGEARLAELQRLTERHGELEREIAAGEAALSELRKEVKGLGERRRDMEKRGAEVEARERGMAEREAKFSAESAEFKAFSADFAKKTADLARDEDKLKRERAELAERRREVEAGAEKINRERGAAQEEIARAKTELAGLEEARLKQEERSRALEARAGELAAAEGMVAARGEELKRREEALLAGRQDVEAAQGRVLAERTGLAEAEKLLAEKTAAAEAARRALEEEREGLAKQREELEKKLDLMEGELAEQFESLAKQTRRLTERRAEIDARTAGLERDTETRIEQATEQLREELKQAEANYEEQLRGFREQVESTQAAAAGWQAREAELQQQVAAAGQEGAGLKAELMRVGEELKTESQGRVQQTELLAQQVKRFEEETAAWQERLDEAVAAGKKLPSEEQFKAAQEAAAGAKAEVGRLTTQLEELAAEREEMEKRVGVEAARAGQMERHAESVGEKLRGAERELVQLREKYEAARAVGEMAAAGTGTANAGDLEALAEKVGTLEQQRDELAAHLFATRASMRRQAEEALLAKNSMEGEILALQTAKQALERKAQEVRPRAEGADAGGEKVDVQAADEALRHLQETTDWQRERLLRQARNLRAYRKQMQETKAALAGNAADVAKQREQVRSRKENLEQVKRLLEKQEMVMARKLADHNALKTVAAVGIFVIMILGSVFTGVYKFVNPTYQSEAIVQLAPPAGMKGAELQSWLLQQGEVVKSNDVTFAAWKILRGPDEHYGMHDVREQWLASLQKSLAVQVDANSKTLFIRYKGNNADGVTEVANALATAYTTPGVVTGAPAAGGAVSAKAAPADKPFADSRMSTSLSIVAMVLFASLLLVIVFRHYVARQLKEIDQMADEADLADLKGEMA